MTTRNCFWCLAFIVLIVIAAYVNIFINCLTPSCRNPDEAGYINLLEHVLDGKSLSDEGRMRSLRFVFVGMAGLFAENFTNWRIGFTVFNAIMFILTTITFFRLVALFSYSHAFSAALFFVFSFVTLYRGLNILPDMLAWTTIIILLYAFFLGLRKNQKIATYAVVGITGLAVFIRESVISVFFFILLYQLFMEKEPIYTRLKKIAVAILSFFISFFSLQLIIYFLFEYTFIDFFKVQEYIQMASFLGEFSGVILSMLVAFNFSLIFLLFVRKQDFSTQLGKFSLLWMVANLPFLFISPWSGVRLFYMLFPTIYILASVGLHNLFSKHSHNVYVLGMTGIIIFYGFLNSLFNQLIIYFGSILDVWHAISGRIL